jgi:hypothetical protein
MTMPSFLVIGAVRSGTTSLYHYLAQHPQIYMCPVKEPSFFAFEGAPPVSQGLRKKDTLLDCVTDIETYRKLFQGVSGQVAVGEVSPVYLYHPAAPQRIRRYIPDAKLIAILRHPVDSAYSAYLAGRLYGVETIADFGQILRKEEIDRRQPWRLKQRYLDVGFYITYLKRYFDLFDRAQIRVYLYDDLQADPAGVLRDIFRFLGVDDAFIPDLSVQHNVGGLPRNKVWHAIFRLQPILRPLLPPSLRRHLAKYRDRLLGLGLVRQPPLDPQVCAEMSQLYREETLKLQELIQRDLSAWLE